jgi:hypothetical protein
MTGVYWLQHASHCPGNYMRSRNASRRPNQVEWSSQYYFEGLLVLPSLEKATNYTCID